MDTVGVSGSGADHPDRDQQFRYIHRVRQHFLKAGYPVISVDAKNKELIGNFANKGRTWSQEPEQVNAHDFPSDALGRAVPYGIYDITHNQGTVYVGNSYLDFGQNQASKLRQRDGSTRGTDGEQRTRNELTRGWGRRSNLPNCQLIPLPLFSEPISLW